MASLQRENTASLGMDPPDSACEPAVCAHCAVVRASSASPSSESVNVWMVPVSSTYQSIILHNVFQPRMNAIWNYFSTTHCSKVKRAVGVMSMPYLKSFSGSHDTCCLLTLLRILSVLYISSLMTVF